MAVAGLPTVCAFAGRLMRSDSVTSPNVSLEARDIRGHIRGVRPSTVSTSLFAAERSSA